jgi:predicted dehydrogenase
MRLYVNCESEDGYFRDGCVFRNAINIYDTMSVQVFYENRVLVTYSLNAGLPVEGQTIVFNGSEGRIELRNYGSQPWDVDAAAEIRVIRNFSTGEPPLVPLQRRSGSHGGSDKLIRDHIFIPESPDEMGHRAGVRAGILSAIIGIAAYRSIEKGRAIRIEELIDLNKI